MHNLGYPADEATRSSGEEARSAAAPAFALPARSPRLFDVPSRAAVDERAHWLRRQGEIESGPAEDDYTPGHYAVFHDPDRIKLELLHRPTYWEMAG